MCGVWYVVWCVCKCVWCMVNGMWYVYVCCWTGQLDSKDPTQEAKRKEEDP